MHGTINIKSILVVSRNFDVLMEDVDMLQNVFPSLFLLNLILFR